MLSTPYTNYAPSVARHRLTIWLIMATISIFLGWAAFAPLDEIVRGEGKVVPTSKTQIIQSLEGGILSELLVQEGNTIEQGDVIARLSDTKFKGAYGELENQSLALQVRLKRLKSELSKAKSFEIPQFIQQQAPEVVESELQYFDARQTDYQTTLSSLSKAVALQNKEVRILENLSDQELVSERELLKAQQTASETQARLDSFESEYMTTRSDEYAQAFNELNALKQTLEIRRDQLKRTTLIAPVRSIVNKVLINTIGGVISPGEEILELIPLDDELRIEARISPKDIAFVRPDMRATIKLSAYDYTIYGNLSGSVRHISADTFEDEIHRDAPPYYKVTISVDQTSLKKSGEQIEIRPGMLAQAELHVGEKTVLQYLLKPLFKTTEAFREP